LTLVRVQRERTARFLGNAAKSALSGFLAFILLVSAALSVSHSLHQQLHKGGSGSAHSCLICSLSKGQANAADVAPILAIFVSSLLFFIPVLRLTWFPAADRRLAPNRGPPSNPSSRRVVG
jgi:hypothetical protein